MSKRYPGLCIGGPLDGQRAVSQTQRLQADTRPDLPPLSAGPTPIPENLTVTRHTYSWLHVGGFGLWIVEGMTFDDAIKAMALAYEREHGK